MVSIPTALDSPTMKSNKMSSKIMDNIERGCNNQSSEVTSYLTLTCLTISSFHIFFPKKILMLSFYKLRKTSNASYIKMSII